MAKRLVHNYIEHLNFDINAIVKDELIDDQKIDLWEDRDVYFKDKISKKMILTVFPSKPFHLTEGKKTGNRYLQIF